MQFAPINIKGPGPMDFRPGRRAGAGGGGLAGWWVVVAMGWAACPVSRNFDMGVGFGDAGPQGWGWAPPNPTAWYLAGVGPGFSS